VFVVTGLEFSFGFSVPDIGESTTSIFFQVLRTTNELTGTVKQDVFSSTLGPEGTPVNRGYSSQLVGGLVAIGYGDARGFLGVGATSVTHDAQHFIPTDTVTLDSWIFRQAVFVSVDNSTGTFSETYTFRALTPTPVPEPTSSLTIPSGAAMLLALAKLRSVSLIH
jgi:hypothetical protein